MKTVAEYPIVRGGKVFWRGYIPAPSEGAVRSETDAEFQVRIDTGNEDVPGLLVRLTPDEITLLRQAAGCFRLVYGDNILIARELDALVDRIARVRGGR